MTIETMTVKEFKDACQSQGVTREKLQFICPMCGTVQCAQDLIDAGAGKDFDEVEKYLGFSCLGRFTNYGPPRKEPDGKPCNWTLGGLFQMHKFEVITEDGKHHPHFKPVVIAKEEVQS